MAYVPTCINVHAFKQDENGQTHCEDRDPDVAGWSVFVRETNPANEDDWTVGIDEDFETSEAAMARAEQLSAELGIPVEEY